jgi:hypothetical protein
MIFSLLLILIFLKFIILFYYIFESSVFSTYVTEIPSGFPTDIIIPKNYSNEELENIKKNQGLL